MFAVFLFDSESSVPSRFSQIRTQIKSEVAAASEDQILEADPEAWAKGISETNQVAEPTVVLDEATIEDLGQVEVDCTDMAGISYSSNEMGRPIIRDGRRLELSIPAEGDLSLFLTQVPGGHCREQSLITTSFGSGSGRLSKALRLSTGRLMITRTGSAT